VATDIVVLYNLALDSIGARNNISLPSEQSREAEVCNLWFPNVRDQVLASASWPEATKMERLALLSAQDADEDQTWAQGDPRPDLSNAYALPVDCLRPQYISGYGRFTLQSYGVDGRALMTNGTSPILVYTFRQKNIAMWSAELQMAIMYALAANICTPLTGKTSRTKVLIEQANQHIIAARETAANMGDEGFESIPDWISARGYSGGVSQTRYLYPFGSLLSANVN
jgi:hypothetical protein